MSRFGFYSHKHAETTYSNLSTKESGLPKIPIYLLPHSGPIEVTATIDANNKEEALQYFSQYKGDFPDAIFIGEIPTKSEFLYSY